MVPDWETDKLYLSERLPYRHPQFYKNLCGILDPHGINYHLIGPTNDIWIRDYMPVQVDAANFVQFRYSPDYLQSKKWANTITNAEDICNKLLLRTQKSDLIVDAGNVIKGGDKVIMCDKVFKENGNLPKETVINNLRNLFQLKNICIIPQEPGDYTGHADGMVRFLTDDIVLVNDYRNKNGAFRKNLLTTLRDNNLEFIEIPCFHNAPYGTATGYYINYLQLENLIIVPTFGIAEDKVAIRKFREIFEGQKIVSLNCSDIANEGGVLNCISWTIKSSL